MLHACSSYSRTYTFFCTFTAPSGEPLNFEGRSDTPRSISLSWDPPLQQEQNGIIRKYVITLMTVDNSEVTIVSSISSSQTIHGLRAYTTYLCTVAAYTISVGPATEQLQIQTAEDGRLLLLHYYGMVWAYPNVTHTCTHTPTHTHTHTFPLS